jgi:nitrogen fixation NifU-like protein
VKVHCSCLAEEAVRSALWDYSVKSGVTIEGLKEPVEEIAGE